MDARRPGRGELRQFPAATCCSRARSAKRITGNSCFSSAPSSSCEQSITRSSHIRCRCACVVVSGEERARLLGNTMPARRGSRVSCWSSSWRLEPRCWRSTISLAGVPLLFVLAGAGDVAAMSARRFPLPCGGGRRRYRLCRTGVLIALLAWLDRHHASGRALFDVGDLRHRRRGACVEAAICLAGSCRNAAIGP